MEPAATPLVVEVGPAPAVARPLPPVLAILDDSSAARPSWPRRLRAALRNRMRLAWVRLCFRLWRVHELRGWAVRQRQRARLALLRRRHRRLMAVAARPAPLPAAARLGGEAPCSSAPG